MRRWLPTTVRLGRTARFAPQSLVPEFAWLEAIVNGVVHRSYSMAGDHIRVELFHDRLEVESPGRLPGLVRLDNIRSTRFARNPRIARAVADLGYGRELGEGVNRMFEEMERAGLPLPLYTQPAASVQVTFLVEGTFAEILRQLPRGSDRLAEWMAREGNVTTTQAVELLGQSRPTVLGLLHRLESRGLLEHVGSSPKDPRGFWRLKVRVTRDGGPSQT
jgi:ATP-dependent DNA helicase RecG